MYRFCLHKILTVYLAWTLDGPCKLAAVLGVGCLCLGSFGLRNTFWAPISTSLHVGTLPQAVTKGFHGILL